MSWIEEQDWFGTEDIALDAEQDYQSQLEDHLWETKDGFLIKIEDMETSHIKNCLHKIYKSNGTWRSEYTRLFENELRRRKFQSTNNK
jgi:hypothetical protein